MLKPPMRGEMLTFGNNLAKIKAQTPRTHWPQRGTHACARALELTVQARTYGGANGFVVGHIECTPSPPRARVFFRCSLGS